MVRLPAHAKEALGLQKIVYNIRQAQRKANARRARKTTRLVRQLRAIYVRPERHRSGSISSFSPMSVVSVSDAEEDFTDDDNNNRSSSDLDTDNSLSLSSAIDSRCVQGKREAKDGGGVGADRSGSDTSSRDLYTSTPLR
jgi:hypothetical protein